MKQENRKYKDLAVNSVIFAISSFGSRILSFLLVPLYTAILSTEEYGTADLISVTSELLGFVFTLNIADAVLRFAIDRETRQEEILSYGLKVQFTGTLILGVILFIVSKSGLLSFDNYFYIFVLITFFLHTLHKTANNYLRAINKLKVVGISGIIHTAVTIVSNILCLVVFKMGLLGYLISLSLGYAVTIVFCFMFFGASLKEILSSKCEKKVGKEMVSYSAPLIFNGIAWWMNSSLDKFFIISMIGISANGVYAVSYKIPTLLTLFNYIFSQAWNLSAIKEYDREDKDGFFANTYSAYNAGLVLLCSALIFGNIFIAKLLYSKEFFEAWNYTSALLISIVFSAMSSFIGSIFTAVKNSKIFSVSTVAAALINTVLNYFLIKSMGVQGAAVATAISFFSIWLIRLICARKYIRWKINIVRDLISYLLLTAQAVIEHFGNHYYLVQAAILIVLVLMYFKDVKTLIQKALEMVFKKKGNAEAQSAS